MTKKEFKAVFDIFSQHSKLTDEMHEELRDYCQENWDEIKNMDETEELYQFLKETLEEIEPDYADIDVEISMEGVTVAIFPWGAVLIRIPGIEMLPRLKAKIDKVYDELDAEQIQLFRELMQEIEQKSGEGDD